MDQCKAELADLVDLVAIERKGAVEIAADHFLAVDEDGAICRLVASALGAVMVFKKSEHGRTRHFCARVMAVTRVGSLTRCDFQEQEQATAGEAFVAGIEDSIRKGARRSDHRFRL